MPLQWAGVSSEWLPVPARPPAARWTMFNGASTSWQAAAVSACTAVSEASRSTGDSHCRPPAAAGDLCVPLSYLWGGDATAVLTEPRHRWHWASFVRRLPSPLCLLSLDLREYSFFRQVQVQSFPETGNRKTIRYEIGRGIWNPLRSLQSSAWHVAGHLTEP